MIKTQVDTIDQKSFPVLKYEDSLSYFLGWTNKNIKLGWLDFSFSSLLLTKMIW